MPDDDVAVGPRARARPAGLRPDPAVRDRRVAGRGAGERPPRPRGDLHRAVGGAQRLLEPGCRRTSPARRPHAFFQWTRERAAVVAGIVDSTISPRRHLAVPRARAVARAGRHDRAAAGHARAGRVPPGRRCSARAAPARPTCAGTAASRRTRARRGSCSTGSSRARSSTPWVRRNSACSPARPAARPGPAWGTRRGCARPLRGPAWSTAGCPTSWGVCRSRWRRVQRSLSAAAPPLPVYYFPSGQRDHDLDRGVLRFDDEPVARRAHHGVHLRRAG